MKNQLIAFSLVVAGALFVPESLHAHGGQWRGPGDTVPPGGGGGTRGGPATPRPSGPSTPNPGGPGSPGGPVGPNGSGPLAPTTQGPNLQIPEDLTAWMFWWEFNKEPYLDLKSRIHGDDPETGSAGYYLGRGGRALAKDRLRPTRGQIEEKVIPALVGALDGESNSDIVTACLMGLAKVGDIPDENGDSLFEELIRARLRDNEGEVVETATIALGILGHDQCVDHLFQLLADSPTGRALVGRGEVPERVRAFAAYGLGLVGSRPALMARRARIVRGLAEIVESEASRNREVQVACLIGIGLVPLEVEPVAAETSEASVESGRRAQLDWLLGVLEDRSYPVFSRAHVPTALARLVRATESAPAAPAEYRTTIANALRQRLSRRSDEPREVVQSCALALGLLGDFDDEEGDREIRAALAAVPTHVKDAQARSFSLIAMAKLGGNLEAHAECAAGLLDAQRYIVGQYARGKSRIRPWAALSIGILGHDLAATGRAPEKVRELAQVVNTGLRDERNPALLGALAISAGLIGDPTSIDPLLANLERLRDDTARGYMAVALGLLGERRAIEPIQNVVRESKYRPELLQQAGIALGLLGDKEAATSLRHMLESSTTLASQAAVAQALGFIGDRRSIDPLVTVLEDEESPTPLARAFAAAALGIVADDDRLPWNTAIGVDLNYRASTLTLNCTDGTGILNIL